MDILSESEAIHRKAPAGNPGIREQFNLIAEKYDANRRKFIPCFDAFYRASTRTALALTNAPRKVLDLGAGTGILSMYFLEACPDAEYVLTDVAEAMLDVARRRFEGCANVSYLVLDYIQELPAGNFDAVISALSIHHLENDAKAVLFRRIAAKLPAGGWFFNFDQFCAEDETLNNVQNDLWVKHILASGMASEEIARWRDRRQLDRECSVEKEIDMLKQNGFAVAECFFHSGKFAVIAAQKK